MNIELKNVKFMESLSEGTNCFSADLFVNGRKVGFAKNAGHGGCTEYSHHFDEKNIVHNREAIRLAEVYCASLPDIDYGYFKIKSTLENVIDCLFEKWLIARDSKKADKKMEKNFQTQICVGVPNSSSYSMYNLKKPLELYPREKLQQFINGTVKPNLKEGEVILNTNLEKLGLKK